MKIMRQISKIYGMYWWKEEDGEQCEGKLRIFLIV